MRRWITILLAVILVVLVAKYILFGVSMKVPDKSNYTIDLEALHKTAVAGGALPDHIEVEKLADFKFPHAFVVAGADFSWHPMVLLANRVVYADGTSVIVDTGMTNQDASSMHADYHQAAYDKLVKAMKEAKAIVVTHEHPDHIGGLVREFSDPTIMSHAKITREQWESPKLDRDMIDKTVAAKLTPIDYSGLYAVAPGVVLQKAPGHSVGSQLIYVELANGQRYLFVGDVVWSQENIRERKGRPLIARLLLHENQEQSANLISALAALPNDVHIMVAHDKEEYESDIARGRLKDGFSVN